MATQYLSFLNSPNASLLASNASLNYITTTTTITGPAAIAKHLEAQSKQVERKAQNVLGSVETANGFCLETETTLLFKNGGGAYLPQLDENLLDEREVTFPLIHMVRLSSQGGIESIRLYWDQGTLLKQVEAIGRTGRNWPIRHGKDQVRTVKQAVAAAAGGSARDQGPAPLSVRSPNEVTNSNHTKRESVSSNRNAHAILSPRDPNEDSNDRYSGPSHATRASAKPAPRDYGDLFVAGDETPRSDSISRSRSSSKADGVVLKAGAGKHFSQNRLFDENDPPASPRSPERKKTYSQKYERFEFGDGEDLQKQSAKPHKPSKNDKKWDFEDFNTPPKFSEKTRPDYTRNWGADVDEGDPESPPKRPIVHAARPDSKTHFEIADDSPAGGDPTKRKSFQRQPRAEKHLNPTDESTPKASSLNTTSTDNDRRGQDFASQFSIQDETPTHRKIYKTAGDGMGGRKGGQNPFVHENDRKIYKTAGDGMGGRTGARNWSIGDDFDNEAEVRPTARSRRAQAEAGADF